MTEMKSWGMYAAVSLKKPIELNVRTLGIQSVLYSVKVIGGIEVF